MFPYPLLHAEFRTDAGTQPAFVDGRYRYDYLQYYDRPKLPPSWMDPELFAKMCKNSPEVQKVLARAFRSNKRAPAIRALLPLLDEILAEEYLDYLFKQFEKRREIFAEWLIANYAEGRLIEEEKRKSKKARRLARIQRDD